jgi:uncharacterized coiled-coil DUF342 family protein
MSSDPSPDDSSSRRDATLAFVLQSLREHEQNLDKLIGKLAELTPQIDHTRELYGRFDEVEARVGDLEREIKRLISYFAMYQNGEF